MFVLEDYARALTHQKVVSVTLDSGTWAGGEGADAVGVPYLNNNPCRSTHKG